ncbi:unnamed protein product [Penicillium glandicola]
MSAVGVTIDAYAILGVGRDADIPEINLAYKRLALKFHPDKAGNAAATIERFRKIQDAVEVLRDEYRRGLLDEALRRRTKRHLDPEDATPAWAYKGNSSRPTKRERYGSAAFDWETYTAKSPFYKPMHRRQFSGSYYYSYGTSVHMDPDSTESKAKRAQFQAENVQWENEWAGIDPEVQKARAELRKENMRARMKRDLADMAKDEGEDTKYADIVDHVVEGVLDDLDFGHDQKFEDFVDVPEETIKTCNPADTFDTFAYEHAKQFRPNDDGPIYSDCSSTPQSAASNNASVDSSTSDDSTNYPNYSHPADEHPTFKSTAEDSESVTDDSTSEADQLINSYMVGHDSLLPLVSFLKQKLADPYGRYTLNDLGGELNGLMLEIYCGWLEDVRLAFPDASPLTVRTDPKLCSHLGMWYKEFCRPVCNVCNLWMPTFILTCPGCGIKACIRCKFADCDPTLGFVMQKQ